MAKRVVVTGMGVISPAGCTLDKFWKNIVKGKNCIDDITYFDTSDYSIKKAAQVLNFNPNKYPEISKYIHKMDPFQRYGVIAALDAKKDAKLEDNYNPERTGVIVGSGSGGSSSMIKQIKLLLEKGPSKLRPSAILKSMADMVASHISMHVGAKGCAFSVGGACATGALNIGEAFRKIKDDYLDICYCGGSDATIDEFNISGFQNMNALSEKGESRPFDSERDGFVMGEGAGILVLENLESAEKRNVKIYAEIVGYGTSDDANHATKPDPKGKGIEKCMVDAMNEAGVSKEKIDYINAHGTATTLNDEIEAKIIEKIFGKNVCVGSTKSMIGHTMGAAGAIESIVAILAIKNSIIPPTTNLKNPENKNINYVLKKTNKGIDYDLNISMGFGGKNASLVFKKYV